jgi:hypothetical protein
MPRPLLYAIVAGGVGFAGGFVGPMIFDPTGGNGPLLGIFITGPGGALLGFVVGLVMDARARRAGRP